MMMTWMENSPSDARVRSTGDRQWEKATNRKNLSFYSDAYYYYESSKSYSVLGLRLEDSDSEEFVARSLLNGHGRASSNVPPPKPHATSSSTKKKQKRKDSPDDLAVDHQLSPSELSDLLYYCSGDRDLLHLVLPIFGDPQKDIEGLTDAEERSMARMWTPAEDGAVMNNRYADFEAIERDKDSQSAIWDRRRYLEDKARNGDDWKLVRFPFK